MWSVVQYVSLHDEWRMWSVVQYASLHDGCFQVFGTDLGYMVMLLAPLRPVCTVSLGSDGRASKHVFVPKARFSTAGSIIPVAMAIAL